VLPAVLTLFAALATQALPKILPTLPAAAYLDKLLATCSESDAYLVRLRTVCVVISLKGVEYAKLDITSTIIDV